MLTEDRVEEVREDVEVEIQETVEFARESPFLDPEAAYEGVYSERSERV